MRIWSWQHVSVIHCWVEPSLLLSSLFKELIIYQPAVDLNIVFNNFLTCRWFEHVLCVLLVLPCAHCAFPVIAEIKRQRWLIKLSEEAGALYITRPYNSAQQTTQCHYRRSKSQHRPCNPCGVVVMQTTLYPCARAREDWEVETWGGWGGGGNWDHHTHIFVSCLLT